LVLPALALSGVGDAFRVQAANSKMQMTIIGVIDFICSSWRLCVG
jgi:hypothetical protein